MFKIYQYSYVFLILRDMIAVSIGFIQSDVSTKKLYWLVYYYPLLVRRLYGFRLLRSCIWILSFYHTFLINFTSLHTTMRFFLPFLLATNDINLPFHSFLFPNLLLLIKAFPFISRNQAINDTNSHRMSAISA
jgi:hypothetical protein